MYHYIPDSVWPLRFIFFFSHLREPGRKKKYRLKRVERQETYQHQQPELLPVRSGSLFKFFVTNLIWAAEHTVYIFQTSALLIVDLQNDFLILCPQSRVEQWVHNCEVFLIMRNHLTHCYQKKKQLPYSCAYECLRPPVTLQFTSMSHIMYEHGENTQKEFCLKY